MNGGESVNDQTQQQMEIPAEIKAFLESLLEEGNMSSLDEEMKKQMMAELFTHLDQHLTTTIIENLPQDRLDEFIKMNEEQKPQAEIQAYLTQHIPNISQIMANAFMQFRDLYLGNVAVARNAPSGNESTSN